MTTDTAVLAAAVPANSIAAAVAAAVGTVAAVAAAPIAEVVELLKLAGDTQRSVYAGIKKAAAIAAQAMDQRLNPEGKVKQVLAIYQGTLHEINDHNVRSNFTSALWLHADPQAMVTVPVPTKPGEAKVTQLVPARLAIDTSKATVTDVAKQIREIHDANRATGGGRKKNNPLPAASVTAAVQPVAVSPEQTFFDQLEVRMSNAGDMAKIVAALERHGYKVTRGNGTVAPSVKAAVVDTAIAVALQAATPKRVK